jgi:hypothetical protein
MMDAETVVRLNSELYADELNAGQFEMKDQSDRYWHPLQNVKSELRTEILANHGFEHQYDIECCAPTLLLQLARKHGFDERSNFITPYIANRTPYRIDLAERAEMTIKQVKSVVNALFCGARIGNNSHFALTHVLEHDVAKIMYLQQDEGIIGLRNEIKTVWEYIIEGEAIPRRYTIIKKGKHAGTKRRLPVNSKQKWGVYFSLEREVMTAILEYLRMNDNDCFIEHDGWTSKKPIDMEACIAFVFEKTGFRIKLDHNDHSKKSVDCSEGSDISFEDTSEVIETSTQAQIADGLKNKNSLANWTPSLIVHDQMDFYTNRALRRRLLEELIS